MKKRKSLFYNIYNNRSLIVMVLPAVLFFLIFSYLPMAGMVIAFKKFNYTDGIFGSPWSGFENFKFFFIGGKAYKVIFNTMAYNFTFIIAGVIVQVSTAIFLSEVGSRIFKKVTQTMMFLPYFLSWVVVGAFIYNIFNYEFGFLNTILKSIGMNPVNVYEETWIWKFILVVFNIWKWTGYGSLIYLAAIMGIENELFEAADIDGASKFKKIKYITIPMLVPQMVILFLMGIGTIFRGDFSMFYQVTGNNPLLYDSTDVIDTFVFRTLLQLQDFGMASAAGVLQSVLCFFMLLFTNTLVRKINPDYALF